MLAKKLCFTGCANDLHDKALPAQKAEMNLVFPGNALAVRRALKASMVGLRHLDLSQDEKGVVEIVLAEVLNNIVEHAYDDTHTGVIELTVSRQDDDLIFLVLDDGLPLPEAKVPAGAAHNLNTPTSDLPEGGFGWFLIKQLTRNLSYQRSGNRNRLSFSIALKDTQSF
ncbi:ATP-binding protein [uncultured Aliiroseovarius sp.]|uniref:ATP-binding protein n=1 Tax=uncultured Aliiroseovarius sp. TaxID=1658783 RepID=UPI00260777E4|nr:ATP-binding protein [uncultured Aliiroseovarius sp.]